MDSLLPYRTLFEAELDYGHFNALRTSEDAAAGVCRAGQGPFHWILDPARPLSPYYNRAVLVPSVSGPEPQPAPDFSRLPAAIRGVEVPALLQSEIVSESLAAMGFKPGSSLSYLIAEPEREQGVEHRIERFGTEQADEFFDLLELSGADFPDEKRNRTSSYYCTDQFRCHVAFSKSGEPTGWATSYLCGDGDSVFFANAFTLEKFRRQGFHSALMRARLNEVIALGRKRAYTDVEPDSQSHRNCERLGFRFLADTMIWERQ